jgi:hypothetical protein
MVRGCRSIIVITVCVLIINSDIVGVKINHSRHFPIIHNCLFDVLVVRRPIPAWKKSHILYMFMYRKSDLTGRTA